MAQLGSVVTVVDLSDVALSRAKERAAAVGTELQTVRQDVLEFAEAKGGGFDMALSFGTVEHFRPPLRQKMCAAHVDLVKPGGVIIISVPNLFFLPHEILKRLLICRGKWFFGYEGSFTQWELRREASRLGLIHANRQGTDVVDDLRKYAEIVRGTRLWHRLLPWKKNRQEQNPATGEIRDSSGEIRTFINRYLGHDITLFGVKPS